MKELIIIGARGFGREVFNLAQECVEAGAAFTVKGFLDDNKTALDGYPGYPPIIDSVEDYSPKENDVFICALGDPHWQKYYSEIILKKGGVFVNLIHPTAYVGKNTRIGTGCIILKDVHISCDVSFGDFVTCQPKSVIGHDAKVENYCHIGTVSTLGGYTTVKSSTTLHPGSILLPHVTVENDCIVGAGAVVIRKVKSGSTVYGNPAKILKF